MTTTTTTTETPQVSEKFARLALAIIHPDPENRAAPIDADLRKSIAEHGVLEPVLVVPHPDIDNEFLLVAGERRWRAATETKRVDIPAVINTGLTETDRIVRQITENLHRLDLDVIAEANQFARLATLGMGIRALAKAVSRSQRCVRDRLRLLELPTQGQQLITTTAWTIEDGLAALALLDHPDQLTELIEEGRSNVSWRVQRVMADIDREAVVHNLVEQAQADGKRLILATDTHHRLDEIGVTEADHRGEECHAYLVRVPSFGEPSLVTVCTYRKAHTKRGKSDIKTAPPSASPAEQADTEARKAKREANAERIDAITAAVSNKVSRNDSVAVVFPALLAVVSADIAKRTAKVLGIEGDKDTDWVTVLRDYATASDAAMIRAATTAALIEADRQLHSGWSDQYRLAEGLTHFLKARGWKPSGFDKQRLKTLKTNHR